MTKQTRLFNLQAADPSWRVCLKEGLEKINPDYLDHLYHTHHWLPGHDNIFNAFSLSLNKINYVLFGESPYPRPQSANGFAFWDAAVTDLWSPTGLSKPVNRATSLRNILKMLLVAEGVLDPQHTGQEEIAKINKKSFIQTNTELFGHLLDHGFLLLNATPVLQPKGVRKDAAAWLPFISFVLRYLLQHRPQVQLILLGKIANLINKLIPDPSIKKFYAEHPYNISFINNPTIIHFFKPFHLLRT